MKPKRRIKRKSRRKITIEVDSKVRRELDRIIKYYKKNRKKKFKETDILWGTIKMIKHFKLSHELESILFKEEVK